MQITFNPNYVLKPDDGRALILPKTSVELTTAEVSNFEIAIHPIHAIILSFVNGEEFDVCVDKAANYLGISRDNVSIFLQKLANSDVALEITRQEGITLKFPKNTVIHSGFSRHPAYDADDFYCEKPDVTIKRHLTPTSVTLMVNNKCGTDCIYCYADRRNKMDCLISWPRVQKLLREARSANVETFDIIGGELFLYKNWRDLTTEMRMHGYVPFFSTKIPLAESAIRHLADNNVDSLQISIDSLVKNKLCSMLNVSERYEEQMKHTFELLEQYGIKVIVHSIITSENDNIEDIDSLYNFLQQFNNVSRWRIDPCGPSLYLVNNRSFESLRPDADKFAKLLGHVECIKQHSAFPILYGSKLNKTFSSDLSKADRSLIYKQRSVCAGNFSSLFILPDGNVTICEELYWQPQFLIGNINNQSLLDVWNSKKALDLYNLSQNNFPEDSVCSSCSQFSSCRPVKGVCWRDVVMAYGQDKWYYPDVNCPRAPNPEMFSHV